jgi:hypothetical protein
MDTEQVRMCTYMDDLLPTEQLSRTPDRLQQLRSFFGLMGFTRAVLSPCGTNEVSSAKTVVRGQGEPCAKRKASFNHYRITALEKPAYVWASKAQASLICKCHNLSDC